MYFVTACTANRQKLLATEEWSQQGEIFHLEFHNARF